VGDREILETYLNSASKNTSETDIFPHGTKSLLTSAIILKILGTTLYNSAPLGDQMPWICVPLHYNMVSFIHIHYILCLCNNFFPQYSHNF